MSKIMGTTYDKATGYQIIGCILFVVAMLIADDGVMAKIGYNDMEAKVYIDEDGNEKVQTSVSKKLINMTFIISIPALIVATVVCITSISGVKKTAVDKSTDLGNRAATSSAEALKSELEKELVITASDKASLAKEKLDSYISSAKHASDYAKELYSSPNSYAAKEVKFPIQENVGKWAMQRLIANESIPYNSIKRENGLLGNIEPLFRSIVENSDNVATIYLGTESGFLISYDPNSGDAELGTENYYEFRLSDWYKSGKLAKEPFFTAAYQDSYGRGLTITCVSPIYTENGVFKGCIGIDVLINDINRLMVNDGIEEPNYAALIGPDGEIIASRDFDGFSDEQHNIYDRDINLPLKELPNSELFSDENGVSVIGEGNDATYIAHSKVSLTNWTLCIMSPVSQIIKPALEIKDNIESNTEAVAGAVNNSISVIIENCLVMFAIIILAITFFVGKLADRITLPLRHLEKDVQEISEGNFGKKTTVSTDDEIGSLARAFSSMSVSLKKYIVDLKDATAKEERIASELSVATRIQADMLPSDFSAFENNKEFDVYASMDPAKEVGGDFYDIFMIDDTHLALVMADVSGKGVPAALFMTVSKLLLNSQTNVSTEPADILAAVNDKLCENNKEGMFVTVWMGIMDLTTGVVKAANAGHEFPAISKKGEKFELLHDKHGMVLAGIEHSRYKQYEFTLEPGDRLFLYTDGVPEATNAENQLFGTDRMVEWLNKEEGISPAEVLKKVREGVDNFVDKAPQFDDITMLCLEYKEKSKANGDKKSEVENG